jgi:hypothetical protein
MRKSIFQVQKTLLVAVIIIMSNCSPSLKDNKITLDYSNLEATLRKDAGFINLVETNANYISQLTLSLRNDQNNSLALIYSKYNSLDAFVALSTQTERKAFSGLTNSYNKDLVEGYNNLSNGLQTKYNFSHDDLVNLIVKSTHENIVSKGKSFLRLPADCGTVCNQVAMGVFHQFIPRGLEAAVSYANVAYYGCISGCLSQK